MKYRDHMTPAPAPARGPLPSLPKLLPETTPEEVLAPPPEENEEAGKTFARFQEMLQEVEQTAAQYDMTRHYARSILTTEEQEEVFADEPITSIRTNVIPLPVTPGAKR